KSLIILQYRFSRSVTGFRERTTDKADPRRNKDKSRAHLWFIDRAEEGWERIKEPNRNDIADVWTWYANSPAATVLHNTDKNALQNHPQVQPCARSTFQGSE